jgi:hypothetical protein
MTANVFYFGDQSTEPYNSLTDLLCESQNSDLLGTFLRSCYDALLSAIAVLPPEHRQLFQGRDFAQLVDHVQAREIRHAAVTSVLSCVTQIGWLVMYETSALIQYFVSYIWWADIVNAMGRFGYRIRVQLLVSALANWPP